MLDDIDFRLLKILQETALQTAQELGDALNLSASQAGRRRQRLEQQGYIKGFRATLNSEKLGLNVQAFVQVSMVTHSAETANAFQTLLKTRHEVVSAWSLTGEADYLLRIFCTDLKALNTLVHEVFLPHSAVARVQSQIVMEQTKADSPLPL